MPFGTAITMVLLIARHNLPQQVAADLYGLSQPTVSRIWRYLLALIGQVTAMDRKHLAQALQAGVVLIDGTPIPTGNRAGTGTTNFNGKHRKQALNIQVAARLNGALVAVSVPVRGSRHDSRALEEVGWADQITAARAGNELLAVFADTALRQAHPTDAARRRRMCPARAPTRSGTARSPRCAHRSSGPSPTSSSGRSCRSATAAD
jgi:hypothetical protein